MPLPVDAGVVTFRFACLRAVDGPGRLRLALQQGLEYPPAEHDIPRLGIGPVDTLGHTHHRGRDTVSSEDNVPVQLSELGHLHIPLGELPIYPLTTLKHGYPVGVGNTLVLLAPPGYQALKVSI